MDHVQEVESGTLRLLLVRRIRLLVAFTIVYNLIEAVVALVAGSVASSSALVGFGLDSVIEVASALGVAWQFAATDHRARERVALRITACSFFALAAFIGVDATTDLLAGREPAHSSVGIFIAALSLVVMPIASAAQRRAGRRLGSHSAVADSQQTMLCTYMSAALLLGLVANSALGWWWADPAAALVIAALAVREGLNAWRGDACCTNVMAVVSASETQEALDQCCDNEARPVSGDPAAGAGTLEPAPDPAGRPLFAIRAKRRCSCDNECSIC